MLVSGTIGNTTYKSEAPIAGPTQVVASASTIDTTQSDAAATKTGSSSQKNQKTNNLGVEEAVREYFADIPLMVEVSRCESRFRQFNTDGSVIRGKVNANDVGALQINETYHLKRAIKLGYDLNSLQGNMAYARLLYEEQGPQPWSSSYPCWGKSPLAANFKPKSRTVIVSAPSAPAVTAMNVSDDAASTTVMAKEIAVTPTTDVTNAATAITAVSAVLNTPVTANVSTLAER